MSTSTDRAKIFVALAKIDPDRLFSVIAPLCERYPVEAVSSPVAGLAMMRLKESVNGDAFNIGEIPLSTAIVKLQVDEHHSVMGASHIMADDLELATALAVCDAILTHDLPGGEVLQDLYREGLQTLDRERDIRQSILNRSRVRFALLNEEGGA